MTPNTPNQRVLSDREAEALLALCDRRAAWNRGAQIWRMRAGGSRMQNNKGRD